jgi:signal transduction histidine kinase
MAPGSAKNRAQVRGTAHDPVPFDLAVVLHEIRQPLSAVFALAEAARSHPDVPADVRGLLTQLIEEAQEVSAAVGSVLADPGSPSEPGDAVVDLDELLSSVVDSFRRTWSGTVRRSGSGGALEVRGDRTPLRRCLVNLVDNAVRAAGPEGTVTVTVQRRSQAVRVLVDDDGPGFGRVPGRTGIGLAATREALHRMGGVLSTDVPSRNGGACVAVALPLLPRGQDPVPPSVHAV